MNVYSLDSLLFEFESKHLFFKDFFEQKFCYLGKINDLLLERIKESANFEKYLWQNENYLKTNIRAVKNGKEIYPSTVTEGNFANWAIKSYNSGYTLICNGIHNNELEIAKLCRGLAEVFRGPVHANSFVTPSGFQGFFPHFDTHDVFIIQLKGKKTWRIYENPKIEIPHLPLIKQGFTLSEGTEGPITWEKEIEPGEALYIPRGCIHAAATIGFPSVHATIGFRPQNWSDLLQSIIVLASERHEILRKSIPLDKLFDSEYLENYSQQILSSIMSKAIAQQAIDELIIKFIATLEPLPKDLDSVAESLKKLEKLSLETIKLKRSFGYICHYKVDDFFNFYFPGFGVVKGEYNLPGSFKTPLSLRETLIFISQNDSFDLINLPGNLNNESKIILVKKLIEMGFLLVQNE